MKDGNLLRFVDGVRAVVGDRFYIQAPEFLEIRLRVNGHDFRIVGTRHQERTGTRDHEKKMSVRVEDVDTLRIGATLLHLAAIRARLIRRDECPGADELVRRFIVFSFDGVKAQNVRRPARGCAERECRRHPRDEPRSIIQKVFVPADGVKAANCRGSGDFGTSPFLGSSLDKPVLASVWLDGGAEGKAQRGREIKC